LSQTGKGGGAPTKFVGLLQVWLKQAFGKRFKNQGNMLPHGVQDDGHSCAMFTSNTLAHGVLDRPLLSAEKIVAERLSWFIRLASTQKITIPTSPESSSSIKEDEPQRRNGLAITDLLNPVIDQPRDYDSDSESDSDISGYEGEDRLEEDDTTTGNKDPASHILPDLASENLARDLESKSDFTMHEPEDDEAINHDTPSLISATTDARTWKNIFGKRARSESSESDSGSSYYSDIDDADPSAHKFIKAGEGSSKSAVASRGLRQKVKEGSFRIVDDKYQRWKKKVLEGDDEAEFDKSNIRKVRHSICGTVVTVKEPYDSVRWKDHLEKCKAKMKGKKALKSPSLFAMGWAVKASKKVEKVDTTDIGEKLQVEHVPCPGITEADNPKVKQYLRRTGALGGGGRSLPVIAKELFSKLFSKLKHKSNRNKVVDAQMHEWKWRNDHGNLRIYSTSCQKKVADRSAAAKRPKPCLDCDNVLRSRAFKNAIRRPIPPDKKFIFVNHRFRNKLLGNIYARTIGVKEIIEAEVCR
jgi:hypothetical protein